MTRVSEPGLILEPPQVVQMVDHARDEHPGEACGLLGGRDGRVETVYPLPNMESSPIRYLAEPQAQVDAMLQIEEQGREIVGIYHSHVDASAYPSPTDVAMAAYPDAFYLIISLSDDRPPILGAFRIQDGEIEEVNIAIQSPERVAS